MLIRAFLCVPPLFRIIFTSCYFYRLGNKAFGSKSYDEAIKHYTEAIQLDATNHVYFSNRSASHGGKGDWADAATDAKECIKLNPSFVKGYYRLATAQTELGNWDAAIATIKQGMNVEPDNSQLSKLLRQVKAKRANAKRAASAASAAANTASNTSGVGPTTSFASTTDRELLDLQEQFITSNREYNTVKANIHKSQREVKMNELTKAELETIPVTEDAKMYRGIGKMFMLSTRGDIMNHLDTCVEEESKREESLKNKAEYLERKMKSQQLNIQELTKSKE